MAHRMLRAAIAVAGVALVQPALALDKQGSAHGGAVEGADTGFGFSGSLGLGFAFYNPTYAARPDNTGLALMRYTAHADIDLIGRRLSIPVDVNVFSDRKKSGAGKFAPSETDFIVGATSTWDAGPGALEFGARVETDRPVDEGNYSQTYVDARTRYLFALAPVVPGLSDALGGGDITGAATLGVFAVNPTYAARPDNSGKALFRYGARTEVSFFHSHAAVSVDATMFTDRESNVVAPSELDFTPALVARFEPYQVQVAYERDMTIDGKGNDSRYVQHFAYVLAEWAFDATPHVHSQPPAKPEEDEAPPPEGDAATKETQQEPPAPAP